MCVSNILSPPDACDVYDSLPPTFCSSVTTQVAAMLKCSSPQFTLRYIDVQHQRGSNDCGLLAVAFAEALCAGNDPHTIRFDQTLMRQHLKVCLEQRSIQRFPTSSRQWRCQKSRVKASKTIKVYCICQLPWEKNDSSNLVQCNKCHEWFHQSCLNISDSVFQDRNQAWCCTYNCKT